MTIRKSFLTLKFLLIFGLDFSQAPEKMSYQSVLRGTNNALVTNQNVRVKISILQGTITGSTAYVEEHTVSTNANGLVSLSIGGGTIISGNFSTINWANGPYFVKMEADPTGGTNYTISGTTQLLSVPYALHAKTAESLVGGSTSGGGFTHYIGEQFGGGVIFSIWKDLQGIEHGLIVDLQNISEGYIWSNRTGTGAEIGITARGSNGLNNSNAIIAQSGHNSSAAQLCLNYSSNGFDDWYLPSQTEFSILWRNFYIVNKTLNNISGATLLQESDGIVTTVPYWTSSENGQNSAFQIYITLGSSGSNSSGSKTSLNKVRAIRAF